MPDITIGAIGAAAIAAFVSLLGLIISKEQKTSEFRQAWIDSLREELTTYLTHLNAIADATRVTYGSHADKVKALAPHYSSLNKATFSIILRLNSSEDRSKKVLSCMKTFQELAGDEGKLIPDSIRPVEGELLNASQDLLKFEWKRVKKGERTFVLAKLVSLALLVGSLLCGAVILARPFVD